VKFWGFVANVYPHMPTNFGRFILIFNKMALIMLGVLMVFLLFQVSSFSKSDCLTSLPMMSDPNLSNLNPLDYQVWEQCWSLIASCNRSQKHFPSLIMHFIWFGLPYRKKPFDNSVKDYHKRLQSANSGHF